MNEPVPSHDRRPSTQLERVSLGIVWRVAVIVALALTLVVAMLLVLWLLARPLALLVAAGIVAAALAPAVTWVTRWVPRTLAILLVYLRVLLVVGAIGWVVVPPLVDQARELVTNAPALAEQREGISDQLDTLPVDDAQVEDAVRRLVERFGSFLVSLPLAIVAATAKILLVLAMSAYLVAAGPALHRFVLSLLAEARREEADAVLQEMNSTLGGYVRAQVLDGAIVGAITYVALSIIGVDYPLVLALIAGLGELVPVVGPIIAAVPALAVALLDSPTQALIVLAFFVALQQLESNILLPVIMRKQADIPPLLTLFALAAGAALGGIFGALLAIPLAGALRVFVLRVAAPAIRGWTGATAEARARRTAVPPAPGLSDGDA